VTWEELEQGIRMEDYRMDTVPGRVEELGDLWAPLLASKGRFDLSRVL
jgi:DNA primase